MDSRKRLHAPDRDGVVVAMPTLQNVGDLLDVNRQRLHAAGQRLIFLGRPFAQLRRQARAQALRAGSISDCEPTPAGSVSDCELRGSDGEPHTLLVAGHQPELFHPGVWVKNFALYGLASKYQAASLNIVVDDDTVKTTALRVPAPPYVRRVLFDHWTGPVPYEERTIVNRPLFASFAQRVGELTQHWPYEPMLPAFWDEVLRQAQHTANLGQCFTAARRTFERAWGCHNPEILLSALCETEPFAYFACHLLTNLTTFHSLYNEIVADYRLRYGIRNRQHPVPDLTVEGDWLEAPFWCWHAAAKRRERLFVRLDNDHVELQVRGQPLVDLRRSTEPLEVWQKLRSIKYKIRTRALTTTLYVRLFLADLFIHGIGGGMYDELTDELIRRFYGCEPPEYLVLSATRWLPLPRPAVTEKDYRRLHHQLRDLYYNPQRHLDVLTADERQSLGPTWEEWARRKQEWIAYQPATRAQRRQRFRMLRMITEELRRPLQPYVESLHRQLQECEHQLRINAVLQRRDYSFCLFPESVLRPFCTQFLH